MGLTIVVVLAIFVVIAPEITIDSNLMTALFGFLGTVVGYLAGSGKELVSSMLQGNPSMNEAESNEVGKE
jgi:hypothetical protein